MTLQEAYSLLGVNSSSSDEQIKAAYRKLAKKYHPDLNPQDKVAEDKFKKISQAYEIVTKGVDEATGVQDPFEGFRHGPEAFAAFFRNSRYREAVLDKKPRPGQHPISLGDLRPLRVPMSLSEVLLRKPVHITVIVQEACSTCLGDVKFWEECKNCSGKGATLKTYKTAHSVLTQTHNCLICRGRGWVKTKTCHVCKDNLIYDRKRDIEIVVPDGYKYGQRLNLSGQGNIGWKVPVGNLVVTPIINFPDVNSLNEEERSQLEKLLEKGDDKVG